MAAVDAVPGISGTGAEQQPGGELHARGGAGEELCAVPDYVQFVMRDGPEVLTAGLCARPWVLRELHII